MNKIISSFLLFILPFTSIYSQSNRSDIGLSAIISSTYIMDEYISKNEYSGKSLYYSVNWEDKNEKRILELGSYFNKIKYLKNSMSKAVAHDFTCSFSYAYHVNNYRLFNRPLWLYLGPGSSIFFHYRDQKIVSSTKAISFASFASLDVAEKAVLVLSDNLEILGIVVISPLSFAARMISLKNPENIPTPVGFLSLFNLININSTVGIKYNLSDNIFFKSGYRFHYVQIFKWDKFRVLQDNFYLQFGVCY